MRNSQNQAAVAVEPREASEQELEILDAHYINLQNIVENGGSIFIDETDVICRIPKASTLEAACECAIAMTTLSPDQFVASPSIETEPETGDVLVQLSLDDVPNLGKFIAGEMSYDAALEDDEEEDF